MDEMENASLVSQEEAAAIVEAVLPDLLETVRNVLHTEPGMRTEIGYLMPESVGRLMQSIRSHL